VLDPSDPVAVVEGLVRAVESGQLAASRIHRAFDRIWRLKTRLAERFGPDVFTAPERYVPRDQVGAEVHQQLATSVADRAVTVLDATPGALPIDGAGRSARSMVIYMTPRARETEPSEAPLGEAVRALVPQVRYHEVDAGTGEASLEALAQEAAQARHVVLALAVTPAAWQTFGLQPAQEDVVHRLADQAPPLIAVALGSPHVLDAVPRAAARLCTYSDVPDAQRALVTHLWDSDRA
jgi:beta-glucosidase-like glycosyl hydrolase